MNVSEVRGTVDRHFGEYLEDLKSLVRIPSISFAGFDEKSVRKSAEAVAKLMKKRGLENVEVLDVEGAHPYAYGEWLHAGPKAPTLLLYAHHDVQPVGREAAWTSPPFEPVERQGPAGLRLYGRGTADDKAGILIHLAAIDAYLKSAGKLPVNVKVVIEGEEEIGSVHLGMFLQKYRERLSADVLVLTDTGNFDSGVPGITIALRGLASLEVEVKSLKGPVHSGMWGGPVPDPVLALAKMLSGLVSSEDGSIELRSIKDNFKEPEGAEYDRMKAIPFDETAFREASGMLTGVEILRRGPSVPGQLWRYPSLTVTAIQASSRAQAGNIINDAAWAKVSIRLVPGLDPKEVLDDLQMTLKQAAPWGVQVEFSHANGANAWSTDPEGPVYEAAAIALEKGYGVKPVFFGCGGSIPFVRPFAKALGGVPALLIGVEDPHTQAHGENESLLISDFLKSIHSQVELFNEVLKAWK